MAVSHNSRSLAALTFRPRTLTDVSSRTTATRFFGVPVSMPVVVAPTGAAGLLWRDGEVALARAAVDAGVPFTAATGSLASVEDLAGAVQAPLWFQLYIWPERQQTFDLIARVKACGCSALMVTVDTAVSPNREYNIRNGFGLPFKVNGANAFDLATHPRWLLSVVCAYMLRGGLPKLANYPPELQDLMARRSQPGVRRTVPQSDNVVWGDLVEVRRRWSGPLLLKGVLRADDARRAVSAGVDGIVVSNHGGRNLDASASPMEVLEQILDAAGPRCEVFVDGGMLRGSDVLKAVASGARGVLAGRGPLWGLAARGGAGASQALDIYRAEIRRTMALLGCAQVEDVTRDLLHRRSSCAAGSDLDTKAKIE